MFLRPKLPIPERLRLIAVLALVGTIAALHFTQDVMAPDFAGDETGWLLASHGTAERLLAGNLDPVAWERREDGYYGSLNPQLGKVLLALPLLARTALRQPWPDYPARYVWEKSYAQNLEEGRVPSPALLRQMRTYTALWGAVLCVVAAWLAYACGGDLAALVAGLWLACNPSLAAASRMVMTDVYFNIFLVLSALSLVVLLRARTLRAYLWRGAGVGVAVALAASVKISAPLYFLLPAALVLWLVYRREQFGWRVLLGAAAAGSAAFLVVVYALNPIAWPDLAHFSARGLREEIALLRSPEATVVEPSRAAAPGEVVSPLNLRGKLVRGLIHPLHADRFEIMERLPNLFAITRPLQVPLLYVRWQVFSKELNQQHPWPAGRVNEIVFGVFVRHSTTFVAGIGGALVFLAGLVMAVRGLGAALGALFQVAAYGARAPAAVLLLYAASIVPWMYLSLWAPWLRYFLPLVVVHALFIGLGASAFLRSRRFIRAD